MMLYKITKSMIHSPDRDTEFFNIIAGVLPKKLISPLSIYNLPRSWITIVGRFHKRN